jgi:hypothetical protein
MTEESEALKLERVETRVSKLAWPGLMFAVLQSICTALIAASGVRFAIGISSLISAIVTSTPAQDFHRDPIRLPMLAFALLGAGINLVVLWQVWRLRRRPASQWRISAISPKKKRMERLQLALSLLTILLVFAELLAHKHLHGVYL